MFIYDSKVNCHHILLPCTLHSRRTYSNRDNPNSAFQIEAFREKLLVSISIETIFVLIQSINQHKYHESS